MSGREITCPYCWQRIDIEDPEGVGCDQEVELVTDCEVCCRPIRVLAFVDESGELGFDVEPES